MGYPAGMRTMQTLESKNHHLTKEVQVSKPGKPWWVWPWVSIPKSNKQMFNLLSTSNSAKLSKLFYLSSHLEPFCRVGCTLPISGPDGIGPRTLQRRSNYATWMTPNRDRTTKERLTLIIDISCSDDQINNVIDDFPSANEVHMSNV